MSRKASYWHLKSDGLASLLFLTLIIKYRSAKSNQAADGLSHLPMTNNEILRNSESDGYETVLRTVMCNDLSEIIKVEKLPLELKKEIQTEIIQQAPDSKKINVHSEMVDVLR